MLGNKAIPSYNNIPAQQFIPALISFLINAMFIAAAIYFFFNLVLGGIDWINSAGDKGKVESARSRVVNAVIGIVIVMSTFMILNFIGGIFGLNITNFNLNSLRITG